jgi:hypothetical protein
MSAFQKKKKTCSNLLYAHPHEKKGIGLLDELRHQYRSSHGIKLLVGRVCRGSPRLDVTAVLKCVVLFLPFPSLDPSCPRPQSRPTTTALPHSLQHLSFSWLDYLAASMTFLVLDGLEA